METKERIVDTLAKGRVVEAMVANIAKQDLSPELKDLCQDIYIILLTYDEAKIVDLWENGEMRFFIARIIINQFRSSNSPFHKTYRKYREMHTDITNKDFIDEE